MSDDVKNAIESAAGLCESECNRMQHDKKTSDHWKDVALSLRFHLMENRDMDQILKEAREEVQPIVDAERAAEHVDASVMNFVMR